MKFYICEHCGNIIEFVKETGVPVMCCGQKMKEMVPGTVDAAVEKHVPVVTVDGNKVKVAVGEVEHPMLEEHYIGFIAIETEQGVQRKTLKPGENLRLNLLCRRRQAGSSLQWCNLHGLWKK
ncbi:MAG: desulfoferrodoxin family protein [Anaerovoracaceae bacterium]